MHAHPVRPAATLGACLILGLAFCSAGCGPATADPEPITTVGGKVSLTYLQKQGDQEYFREEAAGARARATQLGVDLQVVDVGSDASRAVAEVRAAIGRKTNGLIVAAPDPAVGPQVAELARSAKVALLASDDELCTTDPVPSTCDKDQLVARIGFSGTRMGAEVGKRAAQEFAKSGWAQSDTRIVSAWKQDVTVCQDRVNAAEDAFIATAGASIEKIAVPTDNTALGAQSRVAAILATHPRIRHWIVWGCNDENVQGGVTALENAGFKAEDVIGVGLGAYLACKDWNGTKPSGMKAALFINGKDVGALAVQTMYDKLKNGKDFPKEAFAKTTMVDATTWKSAGVSCS
ncbi:substrate-binding domain-containing protein [Kitasatospora sp. NPDC048365]|uniref:substrate-binding domain-containing protein n=1 Tax=Kitasatospora sp. NPDC048365 TaxID=3364050 RepID=UPI003723FC8C